MANASSPSFPVKISDDGKGNPPCRFRAPRDLGRRHPVGAGAGVLPRPGKEDHDEPEYKGFNVLLVMLLGVGASGNADGKADGRNANAYGERPWLNDDPSTPNEKYYQNVEAVLDYANGLGLALVIGIYHARTGKLNPIQMSNARGWARWLGNRFARTPNLIWSMYPEAEPEQLPIVRELAKGLQEGDKGYHLISV